MRQATFQTRISLIAAGLLAGGFSLSGCATEEAIVSGLAPGSWAETWMVGKST